MSRPRGPRRVDRPEDRAELIAVAYEVRRRLIEIGMRAPFEAKHYWPMSDVVVAAAKLLEALGEPVTKGHSIACNPPGFKREA